MRRVVDSANGRAVDVSSSRSARRFGLECISPVRRLLHEQRMASLRAALLCVVVATLLVAAGCAHRSRLAAAPIVARHSSAAPSSDGAADLRDAITKLRQSLRHKQPQEGRELPSTPSSSGRVQPTTNDHAVGTSGKWIVTTTTERETPKVTSSTTRTILRSRPRAAVGHVLRSWPWLLVGLVFLACLVAVARSTRRISEGG